MSLSKDGIDAVCSQGRATNEIVASGISTSLLNDASRSSGRRPKISLMIPCLNEEETLQKVIPEFVEGLRSDPEFDFEVLFIDDHSTDDTPRLLAELCRRFSNVRAIRLGRNCGSHAAYRAGLDFCTGEAVAFTVADLQEGIELIRQSLRIWQKGTAVIGTIAIGRDRGGFFNEAGAQLFYWLRNRLGSASQDANEAAIRVIDRSVVNHCRQYAPRTRNLNSWIFGQPFSTGFIRYRPTQRRFGTSKWTFRKKLRLVIDTLLDTSTIFLTMWLIIGGGLATIGLGITTAMIASYVFGVLKTSDIQMNLLIGAITGCTGLSLLAIGSVGVYVWRILDELRGGPGYFVEQLHGASSPSEDHAAASERNGTAVARPQFLNGRSGQPTKSMTNH